MYFEDKDLLLKYILSRIKIMRALSIAKLVAILVVGITIIFFAGMLVENNLLVKECVWPCFGGIVVLMIVFIWDKSQEQTHVYVTSVEVNNVMFLVENLGLHEYPGIGYGGVCYHYGASIRVNIVKTKVYDKSVSKKRRQVNRQISTMFGSVQNVSFYNQHNYLRANITMVENSDKIVETWVSKDAERLLERTEGVFNIGILSDQGVLLLPAINTVPTISVLKKYDILVRFALECLCKEQEIEEYPSSAE